MKDELQIAIGERVRKQRLKRGMTLDALATASGVSRAMISRIERAEVSATASLLARLCDALGLSLSAFFAEENRPVSPLVRQGCQPVWRDPQTGYLRRAVSPSGMKTRIDIVEVEFPAGARVQFPPLALSFGATQHVWLLEGELEVVADGAQHHLKPGDCLFMSLGAPQAFHNPAPVLARYVVVLNRGG